MKIDQIQKSRNIHIINYFREIFQITKKTFSSTFNKKKPSGPFFLSLNWKRTHFDPELYMIFDCIMMEDEEQEIKNNAWVK